MTAEEIIKGEIEILNQEESKVMKELDYINIRRLGMVDLLAKVSANGTGAKSNSDKDYSNLMDLISAERNVNGKSSAIREFILRYFDKGSKFTTSDVLDQIGEMMHDVQAADVTGAFRVMLNRKQINVVSKGQRGGRSGQIAKAGVYCLA